MAIRVLSGRSAALAATAFAAFAAAPEVRAQSAIGTATVVRNDVTRVRGGQATDLAAGGPVFLQDVVRTGAASSARLVFRDETSLAIAALATFTLDSTVYSDGRPAPKTGLTLAEGAFRFVSGAVAKNVEVRTSVATIGIRGTAFDVLSSATRTTVTLRSGIVELCPIAGPRICVTLRRAGETGTVTLGGPATRSGTRFSFSGQCEADPALCGRGAAPGRVRLAGPIPDAIPVPPEPAAALCGR